MIFDILQFYEVIGACRSVGMADEPRVNAFKNK